jgi:hypothetical protein
MSTLRITIAESGLFLRSYGQAATSKNAIEEMAGSEILVGADERFRGESLFRPESPTSKASLRSGDASFPSAHRHLR